MKLYMFSSSIFEYYQIYLFPFLLPFPDIVVYWNILLHCTALWFTIFLSNTLHCFALHYITLQNNVLNKTAIHCTVLHYTTLQFSLQKMYFIKLHFTLVNTNFHLRRSFVEWILSTFTPQHKIVMNISKLILCTARCTVGECLELEDL